VTPEQLTAIQEAASLAGLAHIYPPERHPYPRREILERWRTATDQIFVAPDGSGFAAIDPPWLNGLYVLPEAWGTGVAAELHDRAVAALREAGVETARLWVLEENMRARRFYARRGWRPHGETRVVPFPPHPLDLGYSLPLQPKP
jgi:GNAT superfamily N-acetyltransferase